MGLNVLETIPPYLFILTAVTKVSTVKRVKKTLVYLNFKTHVRQQTSTHKTQNSTNYKTETKSPFYLLCRILNAPPYIPHYSKSTLPPTNLHQKDKRAPPVDLQNRKFGFTL